MPTPMPEETQAFLNLLLVRSDPFVRSAALTFTTLHPARDQPPPSRHIRLDNLTAQRQTVQNLLDANQHGWGAYVAVGWRRPGLSRWQRGGIQEVVALPALFVDVDDPSAETLTRLQSFHPTPSCIVHSGGGFHAYWWLADPLTDLVHGRTLLRALARACGGDRLSVGQSLRLPGTINTKPTRGGARCHLVTLSEQRYAPATFAPLLPPPVVPVAVPTRARSPTREPGCEGEVLNTHLIAAVAARLLARGGSRRGDWLAGPCPYPHRHQHGDRHPSFSFNVRSGYGFCHVCGTLLLKDLCRALHIRPALYGGLLHPEAAHAQDRNTPSLAHSHPDLAPDR